MVPVTALGDPSAGGADLPDDAAALVRGLAEGHRALSARLAALETLATAAGDAATADLAVGRIRAHDQHAWMLEATADPSA
jgi:DNA-binding ferritin-like protein